MVTEGRGGVDAGFGGAGGSGGARTCLAVGIDPGVANTGVAAVAGGAVAGDEAVYLTRGVRHVRTKKDPNKGIRRGTDDVRRTSIIVREVARQLDRLAPHCVGIEQYTVFQPTWVSQLSAAARKVVDVGAAALARGTSRGALQAAAQSPQWCVDWAEGVGALEAALGAADGSGVGLGQAAKTLAVWGACVGLCVTRGIPVYVFTPGDVKRRAASGRTRVSKGEVQDWVTGLVVGLDLDLNGVPHTHQNHVADAAALAVLAIEAHGLVESVGG